MGWFDFDLDQTKTCSHSGNVPDSLVTLRSRGPLQFMLLCMAVLSWITRISEWRGLSQLTYPTRT